MNKRRRNILILIIFLAIALVLVAVCFLKPRSAKETPVAGKPAAPTLSPESASTPITQPSTPQENSKNMTIASSAFSDNQTIPALYTCDGDNINPPLVIADVPLSAKSLALIMDDPDAPSGDWVHWLVFNIPPQTTAIAADSSPTGASAGAGTAGKQKYEGPCPPSGTHHYHFRLYALDTLLNLPAGSDKAALLGGMQGHILEEADLVGTYRR